MTAEDDAVQGVLASERTLPADLAERFWVNGTGGVQIACYALASPGPAAPVVLVAHANGYNAGCYGPFLERLSPHCTLFAIDQRGHGASDKPATTPIGEYGADKFAADMAAAVVAVRARIGAGAALHLVSHSLGGIAACGYARGRGRQAFATMTMFEPPIYPQPGHPGMAIAEQMNPRFVTWAKQRKSHFADLDEVEAEFAGLRVYKSFDSKMFKSVTRALVRPGADGNLTLRCPGAVEAAVYDQCRRFPVYDWAREIEVPALILTSDTKVGRDHNWLAEFLLDLAPTMPNGRAEVMTGLRHLMIQEAPQRCADLVLQRVLGG